MTAAHLGERQLFTSRYGLGRYTEDAIPGWERPEWQRRHGDAEPTDQHRCDCPGPSLTYQPCALRCTQEDGRCDECRQWCVAIDSAGNYHHLVAALGVDPQKEDGDAKA